MYYLIKGILHDRENPEIIEGTFEWAVKSEEEKEKALAKLDDCEEVQEVVEITLEECIAHEEKILRSYVRTDYTLRRCLDMEEDEYLVSQKELNAQSELYLKALREYNRREVLMKRLMRMKSIENMRMGEYFKILNELLDAETDEELDALLRELDKN